MSTEENTTAIPAMQSVGRTRQEVGLLVQNELEIAGVTESTFVALREEATALADMNPASDADAAALQKVITKGVRLCGTISSAIEPGKKWAYSLHKAYTSNENEFIGTVKAIIEPLKAKKAAYVARKEMLAQQELEAQERVIKARFVAIEDFDFVRKTGTEGREDYYSNGTTTLEIHQVSMAGEEEWKNIIRGVELAYNEEQDRKKEAERVAAEEAERVRVAKEDLERREREMKEKEERMNAQVNEVRKNELLALGCVDTEDGFIRVASVGLGVVHSFAEEAIDNLYSYTDAEWIVVRESAEQSVKKVREIQEEAKAAAERQALIDSRVKALKEAGWVVLDDQLVVAPNSEEPEEGSVADMTDEDVERFVALGQAELARRKKVEEDRIAQEAVRKEQERVAEAARKAEEERKENERLAALAEAERIAGMGDAGHLATYHDKVQELIAQMGAITMHSATAKLGIRKAIGHLGDAGAVIAGTIKDLKK